MQREIKWNMQREMRQEMKLETKRAQDVRRYCQEKIRDILPVIPIVFIAWLDIKGYDIAVKIIIAIFVIFVIFVVFYGLVMPILVLQVGSLRAREGFANLLDMSWIMRAFIQADYRSSCFITTDDIDPAVKGMEMRCGQKVVYMTYIFPLIIKGKVILHALPAFRIVVGFKPTKKQLEKVQLLASVIPVACGNYALAAYTRAIFVGCIYKQPYGIEINRYLYPGLL